MASSADIRWFKETFHAEITAALKDSVFDADMLCAIACQETGSLWGPMRKKGLAKDDVVRLCCGDTLDSDKGRRAFPKTRADLEAHPKGRDMFKIARKAVEDMAEHVPGFGFVKTRKSKFCHGYGVFQLDLQFFKTEPEYFLERRYEKFANSLKRAIKSLDDALRKRDLHTNPSISDFEFVTVAIAYNTGRFRKNKGLKQGHFDGQKFYGEKVNDFLATLRQIPAPDGVPGGVGDVPAGETFVPPPALPSATGSKLRVDTMITSLRLRREPEISAPPTKNVIAEMPDGWPVRSFDTAPKNGWWHIEVTLSGTTFQGFSSADFLVKDTNTTVLPVLGAGKIPAVSMPRKPDTVTKRAQNANAHSLNETGQPGRVGTTPEELRREIHAIIKHLNPEKAAHKRYAPRDGLTFCNIYAHDFCTLAGVYFPRVWWMTDALAQIDAGNAVKPLYGNTIREMRANDLLRWLNSYGPDFGWQRAASKTDLQNAANLGAVCLIIARRKNEGRSGHVTMVVPETDTHTARRLSSGEVSAPLQSQAGLSNFNYSPSKTDWFKASKFAESALWMHP